MRNAPVLFSFLLACSSTSGAPASTAMDAASPSSGGAGAPGGALAKGGAGGASGAGGAQSGSGGTASGLGGASPGGASGAGAGGTGGGAAGAGGARTDGAVDGARDGAAGADLAPLPAGTPIVYVGGVDIRIFGLDLATGMLTPRATVMAGGGYMAWDPGKKHMYSTATGITAFSIDQRTGGLSRLNSVMVTKDGTTPTGLAHLSVHPTGKWVFAAYFSSGHVASVAAGADGSLGAVVDIEAPGREAHSAWSDAAGKYLFVPCRVANLVGQYVVGADGALTPNMPANVQAQAAGAGPRHMAFHPTQPWAYVLNELGGTTTQYRFDAATGRLTDPATVSNVPMGMTEGSSAHIVVHPNGKFVYASNRMNNNLVVFAIDQTTGRLTPMQHEGGDGMIRTPRNFTLDPTGRYAIVASQNGGTVLVFRIDQNDGKLTRVGGAIPGPSGAQFVGVITLP